VNALPGSFGAAGIRPSPFSMKIGRLTGDGKNHGRGFLADGQESVRIGHSDGAACAPVAKGSRPLADIRNNREIVAALREIAAGKVMYAHPEYLKGVKEEYRPISDDIEFIGDEEYSE